MSSCNCSTYRFPVAVLCPGCVSLFGLLQMQLGVSHRLEGSSVWISGALSVAPSFTGPCPATCTYLPLPPKTAPCVLNSVRPGHLMDSSLPGQHSGKCLWAEHCRTNLTSFPLLRNHSPVLPFAQYLKQVFHTFWFSFLGSYAGRRVLPH